MDAVLRSVVVYGFLLVLLRAMGKRTLAQVTTFDFVLLLVIGEATQQGLLGDDFSVTNALLVVSALVGTDILVSILKQRSPMVATWTEGRPLILVERGRPLDEQLKRSRVDIEDILEAARMSQGVERLDQIKFAVLERSGTISVIPYR